MSARFACAALVAALLPLAPPGGGGSGPLRQAFRQKANLICSRYGHKVDAIKQPETRMKPYLTQTIGVLEQMNRALRRLIPPPADKHRFRHFLALQAQSLGKLRRLERFTAANEQKAYAALRREEPRLHVSPAQALAHPTAATLTEAMSIPAFARYVNGLEALGRAYEPTMRRRERLTKQLGFRHCL